MAVSNAEEKEHLATLAAAAREEQGERQQLAAKIWTGRKQRARHRVPEGKLTRLLNSAKEASDG